MADSFAHLELSGRTAECRELVDRVRAFAEGRMRLRHVTRLEAHGPVFGQQPSEWHESGIKPSDLGLDDDDDYFDVVEASRREDLTIEQALERWPIGQWVGICLEYDIPPGADGYPAIYGSCWWRVRHDLKAAWRCSASITYPTRSVRDDARWAAWVSAFESAAEDALQATRPE